MAMSKCDAALSNPPNTKLGKPPSCGREHVLWAEIGSRGKYVNDWIKTPEDAYNPTGPPLKGGWL